MLAVCKTSEASELVLELANYTATQLKQMLSEQFDCPGRATYLEIPMNDSEPGLIAKRSFHAEFVRKGCCNITQPRGEAGHALACQLIRKLGLLQWRRIVRKRIPANHAVHRDLRQSCTPSPAYRPPA
eukprot:scaffold664251_cov36-Prasinocladus_malaysianus.AAC.1